MDTQQDVIIAGPRKYAINHFLALLAGFCALIFFRLSD